METIQKTKDVLLTFFPVRRSATQKEEFRKWLIKELKRAGHKATEEKYGKYNGTVNVIAGDPERATVFLAAHYGTATRMLLPNYVSPTNPFFHVGYHFLAGFILVLLALVLSFVVTFPVNRPDLTFPLFVIFTVGILLITAYGPANKNNANNNTSGVLALLSIARRMPKNDRICYVFFDNNERSLLGAKSFKKQHPGAERTLFIDFNCVGNGEEMLLMPSKYSRWDEDMLAALDEAFADVEQSDTKLRLINQGLVYYPSDCRKFKFHLSVAACKKGVLGHHIPYLNSKMDTVLDCDNIRMLADGMERFLPVYLAQGDEKKV